MKRNGTCPICYLKRLVGIREKVTEIYDPTAYENGVALTPPMGWSSWNTFKNHIDEDLIYDTAKAMVDSGLKDAGYTYVNLDDISLPQDPILGRDPMDDLVVDADTRRSGEATVSEEGGLCPTLLDVASDQSVQLLGADALADVLTGDE